MSIYKLTGEKLAKVTQTEQRLRPGQIVQGKILKIFPENKAQIQLGGQNMIAKLEAALSIGNTYHFQVQTSDEMIYLKVLSEYIKKQTKTSLAPLMNQLNVKPNKANSSFIQALIHGNIPFDQSQLKEALHIFEQSKDRSAAKQILLEMIGRRFPITWDVFQALSIKNSSQFSSQMNELLEEMKSTNNKTELWTKLEQLISRPISETASLTKQFNLLNEQNKQQIFHVVKGLGMLNQDVDFKGWVSEWQQVGQVLKENQHNIRLPFSLHSNDIVEVFEQLHSNQSGLLNHSQQFLQAWKNALNQPVLAQREFIQLKEQLNQNILPLLPIEQTKFIRELSNNPVQLNSMMNLIVSLGSPITYKEIDTLLKTAQFDKLFLSKGPNEQFMLQLQQVLTYTGLNYEHQLAQKNLEQQSLKSLLLQYVQQSDGTAHEKAGQLLHFINGMQLNSINESDSVIQASLQIPAEKLGLVNDLELEFESRKTEDGKVNPDYCRILFYLDLHGLKQTIIDMHIQKRSVTVTIYNDIQELKRQTVKLIPVLRQGLEALDYKLTSVDFKALQELKSPAKETTEKVYSSYQGVDYRI
ncbi:hypothetical protein [Oceanobacillus profundus]|uniref:Flagellar hook-length control protein FliK n=1 Tax=Oceanobacillus profundus TaxID=372463 RepID=A0A417YK58_9BACI|nr:hypothetical protein [Oceanobacillus profundus]MBR3121598.1 hypothetical protein [Oceanobacillus sp.]PAE30014.1 hypothetical protein CHI07_06125 [Paenibacillus sp. 7884-2]MCM3396334.1 hypothetical protein [Oceanobacillus profundus]MDO6449656.1 hypothetical protein [Oceanobacillus profundus]RHW33658.1 hypothetical protein D1B32_06355 [Oceanobacillus profundus]